MSGFINKEGEIVSDPFKQSELFREQYQSVYSQPDPKYDSDPGFLTGCQKCAAEEVHECGEDVWNYPGAQGRAPGSCSHRRGVKPASESEEAVQSKNPGKSEKPGESWQYGCQDCQINTVVILGPDDWLADYQFTPADFSAALDMLSSTAAPGPDGVPAKMLKNGK